MIMHGDNGDDNKNGVSSSGGGGGGGNDNDWDDNNDIGLIIYSYWHEYCRQKVLHEHATCPPRKQ